MQSLQMRLTLGKCGTCLGFASVWTLGYVH
jgi:hypothetical protein